MREPVAKAIGAMEEAEMFLRLMGMREHTVPDVAFTCGLKVARLECARIALHQHEERSERSRAAAAKARRGS